MPQLIKVPNKSLSFRLKLNYNNIFSQLRMLLGKDAGLFADVNSTALVTSWSTDDRREFRPMSQAPATVEPELRKALATRIQQVSKDLAKAPELAPLVDEILEVPGDDFVFFTLDNSDNPDFILAGWGCRRAHVASTQTGYIKSVSNAFGAVPPPFPPRKPDQANGGNTAPEDNPSGGSANAGSTGTVDNGNTDNGRDTGDADNGNTNGGNSSNGGKTDNGGDSGNGGNTGNSGNGGDSGNGGEVPPPNPPRERKRQSIVLKVINQNGVGVDDCAVEVTSGNDSWSAITDEEGEASIGDLPYYADFTVSFPNLPNIEPRRFQVVPKQEVYAVHIRYLMKYSPVLFVEDQNGNVMYDSEVKVVVNGKETIHNTGDNGVVQLPTMTEGQGFMVIDPANFSTRQEYSVNAENAKQPYHFTIRRRDARNVGIHVIDKDGKPCEGVEVELDVDDSHSAELTNEEGVALFPRSAFRPGQVGLALHLKNGNDIKTSFDYNPEESTYTIRLTTPSKEIEKKKPRRKFNLNWLWLLLIPIIAGLLWWLWPQKQHKPTLAEMEKGVVLVSSEIYYTVDFTALTDNAQQYGTFYFNYDDNNRRIVDGTFNVKDFTPGQGWGTGFLISEDGLIATNRHVADPIPPDHIASVVKNFFREQKNTARHKADSVGGILRTIGPLAMMDENFARQASQLKKEEAYWKQLQQLFEAFLETGDFKVHSHCQTSVAFVGQMINNLSDFTGTILKATGQPGGIEENDVAIIQLKKKDKDIPEGAYIFKIPEKEPLGKADGALPNDANARKLTIIGYNKGVVLADIKNGIHPQPIPGTLIQNSDKYHIVYDANTLAGSSGSPVIDENGQLVAVNNAGLQDGEAKGFGVRTSWLLELVNSLSSDKSQSDK